MTGEQLPVETAPLVFAIRNGDGTTENMWGVGIVRTRAVVYCGGRDAADDTMWCDRFRQSSGLNGRNRKSATTGVLEFLTPGQCLWLNWDLHGPPGSVPCYTLYPARRFWSVRLDVRERLRRAHEFAEWRLPHVLIDEGDGDTVVSILPTGDGVVVRALNGHPVATIGMVRLDPRTRLHVVVANATPGRRADARERAAALDAAGLQSTDWREEDVDELFATMGSDEVGYGLLVREHVAVTTTGDSRNA